MGTRVAEMLNLWASALTVVGAVAWGFVAFFGLNPFRRGLAASMGVERLLYAAVGIAGAWLGAVLLAPRVLVALGVRGVRQLPRRWIRPITGRTLPTIGGTTLGGREVLLPSDTLGRVTALVLGFSYESRFEVEKWSRAIQERFGRNPGVAFFEIPMVPGFYRLMAPMIDEGMRRRTPAEMHDRVLTVYGPVGAFRRVLAASQTSDVWAYLLDRDGRVIFQYGGPFDEGKFRELVSVAEKALRQREAIPAGRRAERLKAT